MKGNFLKPKNYTANSCLDVHMTDVEGSWLTSSFTPKMFRWKIPLSPLYKKGELSFLETLWNNRVIRDQKSIRPIIFSTNLIGLKENAIEVGVCPKESKEYHRQPNTIVNWIIPARYLHRTMTVSKRLEHSHFDWFVFDDMLRKDFFIRKISSYTDQIGLDIARTRNGLRLHDFSCVCPSTRRRAGIYPCTHVASSNRFDLGNPTIFKQKWLTCWTLF